jgi:TrmH family RNA methyltransferase
MPGKNKISHYTSLHKKKYRMMHRQFLAEGLKIAEEVMRESFPCHTILATEEWINQQGGVLNGSSIQMISCTKEELSKISTLESPPQVIAVCEIPEPEMPVVDPAALSLYLDNLRDPGNLGTLIRLADWFGIRHIYTGGETVDWTNPKVIQASMGSFTRVNVSAVNPEQFFRSLQPGCPVLAADLTGTSIYEPSPPLSGVLIIGSESHGINPQLNSFITQRLNIPGYPPGSRSAESLNAAIAAALIIGELRRRVI